MSHYSVYYAKRVSVLGVAGEVTYDTGLGLMLDWSLDGESCLGRLVIKCNYHSRGIRIMRKIIIVNLLY